jgi:26S proteasome non-ATPase regulatory subunit 9
VVVPSGPAEAAGIKQGDLMTKFGSVTKENFTNLRNVSDVAEASKDRSVEITVLRGSESVRLRLTPSSTWGGQGLLGFKIRPVSDTDSSPDR